MNKEFFKTQNGRRVITGICCLILWGITGAIWTSNSNAAIVVMLLCAVFGWQALTRIQPAMFVWMPIFGWFVYFFVKFLLAALIGFFVAPYMLGKQISAAISDSL